LHLRWITWFKAFFDLCIILGLWAQTFVSIGIRMLICLSADHQIWCIRWFDEASICWLLLLCSSLSHVLVLGRLIFGILLLLQFNFGVIYDKIVNIVIGYYISHNFRITMLLLMVSMITSMVVVLVAWWTFFDFANNSFVRMTVLRRVSSGLIMIVAIIFLWGNIWLLASIRLWLRWWRLIDNLIATFVVFVIKRSTLSVILIRLILWWCVEV